jgi:hypothetical protein
MQRSATPWLPKAWPEGSGDRAASRMPDRAKVYKGAPTARYGVASPLGRNCSALCGLARFYRNPDGDGALWAICLVRLLARERPGAWPEGPAKRGSGSEGMLRPRHSSVGVPASCYGVASSFGRHCSALRGRTFASSPFAHSVPQSRRCAGENLFRGSLKSRGG